MLAPHGTCRLVFEPTEHWVVPRDALPLSVTPEPPLLSAMTQGELGSLIATAINALRGPGAAAALVTHVTVSRADPAFAAPSKPIGPFYGADEAQHLAEARGWVVHQDSGRGYRRVVPSPEPTGIVEISAIRALVDAGTLQLAVRVAVGSEETPRELAEQADLVIDGQGAVRSLLEALL